MAIKLDAELIAVLTFLRTHPGVRERLPASRDKTVVYSGGISRGAEVYRAWQLLAQAKAQDPARFDYVTLEERLRQFHVVGFGETLFEYSNRVAQSLKSRGLDDQAAILWRALSGIYVQGARGKVRALILPDAKIGKSVFSLTEVNVLLRQDVLQNIQLDPNLLRDFRLMVKVGSNPTPIVVF
jgi:hypothetical protein